MAQADIFFAMMEEEEKCRTNIICDYVDEIKEIKTKNWNQKKWDMYYYSNFYGVKQYNGMTSYDVWKKYNNNTLFSFKTV